MYKQVIAIVGGISILFAACLGDAQPTAARVIADYRKELERVAAETAQLQQAVQQHNALPALQQQFRKARAAYKKVEWLAEYYFPYTAKKINGPALPEVEADEKNVIIQPEGFQVVEESLFGDKDEQKRAGLLEQVEVLHANIGRLRYVAAQQETTDAHIFDALRLEVFRIISLGITSFDSPLADNSLEEAAAALQGIQHVLSFYPGDKQNKRVVETIEQAIRFVRSSTSVDRFDRMKFITQYLNPLSASLLSLQKELSIPLFTEPRALAARAATLFEKGIFQPDFYTPGMQAYSNPQKVKLGEKLFYDGILSGDGKRSCAGCHAPSKAFTDGLTTSFSVNGRATLRRNAPTLLNAALQPALFYDMRVNYLEDQAKDVISNRDEMHGSLENTVRHLNGNSEYKKLFSGVFGGGAVTEMHVKNAIAAYVRSLVRLNARFDAYMNGRSTAMTQLEIDGFNVFTGRARCATCHFIPLFNGSNPPRFDKIDAEVIGVPANRDTLHPAADGDDGKYNLYKIPLHKGAFKTPTLRNIELTGPYMHNGVFPTLEEVVEFYNRGGGAGLKLEAENQTLSTNRLDLTAYEKESLVVFMKALTDSSYTK